VNNPSFTHGATNPQSKQSHYEKSPGATHAWALLSNRRTRTISFCSTEVEQKVGLSIYVAQLMLW